MDEITALKQCEYMETGFEVSRILAQAGYRMDAAAFVITWGQVAELLAHTLADYGLTPDCLDEDLLLELARSAQQALEDDQVLSWRDIVRLRFTSIPGIMAQLDPPGIEEDEGPLTEQYENAIRLGDDESYWVDGGESADFFEDF